jgi:hypothetical protein
MDIAQSPPHFVVIGIPGVVVRIEVLTTAVVSMMTPIAVIVLLVLAIIIIFIVFL